MKKNALCLMLTFFTGLVAAQMVSPDSTFGVNGVVETDLRHFEPYGVNMCVLPDGKVIMGGSKSENLQIRRYDTQGLEDTSFSSFPINLREYNIGTAVQKDGKIIACALEQLPSRNVGVVRLNVDGDIDLTFGIDGFASTLVDFTNISNLFEQTDGKIVVFGSTDPNVSEVSTTITRFNSDGKIDSSFAEHGHFYHNVRNGYEFLYSGLEQPDGKLLFAGMVRWSTLLIRVNPDGTIDSTFGMNGVVIDSIGGTGLLDEAYGLTIQPDGKILVTGYAETPYTAIIIRYNPDGSRDINFGDQGIQSLPEANEGVGTGQTHEYGGVI